MPADPAPTTHPIDIHCPYCNQVIVPADCMKPLSQFEKGKTTPHADELKIAHVQAMNIVKADFICGNCGRMVYFDLNEKKLDLILSHMVRNV